MKSVGGQVQNLTEKQSEVYSYIVAEPAISRNKLAEKTGINPFAVQKHIEALKKKGYISRTSETTGVWEILDHKTGHA